MCGITAVFSKNNNIFNEAYESLYHLQHRGQDSFGFSYLDNKKQIKIYKQTGLLANNQVSIESNMVMGHVRYPTQGSNDINESQPFYIEGKFHTFSIIHNGQIDVEKIKQILDINFESCSDTKYLLHYISYLFDKYVILNDENIIEIVSDIQKINGSFNCICIIKDFGLLCFKDKYSIRPLILGKKDDNYILSSESISITSINYEIVRDIYSDDIIIFDKMSKFKNLKNMNKQLMPCIFEWIYLAREESIIYGVNVYQVRKMLGKMLANQIMDKVDLKSIDMIIPVPDTSKPVALEMSKVLNKPYSEAITKNRYVNRTFIMDSQTKRKKNIKRKLNIIDHLVRNKNIIIVDDSIVRGNTIKHIVNLLKDHGVNDIYVAISCPRIVNKNKFGIDIPDKESLLCHNKTNSEIEKDLDIKKIFFQNIIDLENTINLLNNNIYSFENSIFMD